MVNYILNSFKGIKIKDKNLELSLNLFEKWDYEMNEFSQVPAIYAYFYKYLLENIYLDEMGKDLFNEFVFVTNIPYRSINEVLSDSLNSWIDNTATSKYETRDEIIRKSLSDALTYLEASFGKDLKEWQWGKIHKVVFKHAFSGAFSLLDNFINIGPFPVGGDGTTLFNTEYPFNDGIEAFPRFNHKPFENDLGPSMRYIFDFASPDEFYMILNTGQSGNVMSDHYKDMTPLWLKGEYVKVKTDEASIKKNKTVLKLIKK
jgi:penicillin amidase